MNITLEQSEIDKKILFIISELTKLKVESLDPLSDSELINNKLIPFYQKKLDEAYRLKKHLGEIK